MTLYPKAPITEAVIDIQVRCRDGLTPQILERLHESLATEYPDKKPIKFASIVAQLDPEKETRTETTDLPNGWAFVSSDKLQIFQARVNGCSFNRLAPYETWDAFRGEAFRLWKLYRSAASVESLTRLGVRYINRLDLPLPFSDFKDYLRATPEVPPELPQALAGYFFQVTIPVIELSATLVVNQGLVPPAKPDHASVVLDIDLFRDKDLPHSDDDILRLLDTFRMKKDEVFEACITEKMRERFR